MNDSQTSLAETLLAFFHHPAVGAAIIALASLLIGIAFRCQARQQERRAVWLLVAAGLLLRLYAGSDLFLHPWDERYHALVARNLLAHPLTPTLYDTPVLPYDPTDWTATHIWLHKPPLTFWLMAASLWLGGPTELAVRLPSIVLSAVAIVAVFGAGRLLTGPCAAFFAAFLFCINGDLFDLVGGRAPTDHVDTLLVILVVVGIWLAGLHLTQRSRWALVGLGCCTGLAVLTKWLVALLIPGVWLVWGSKKLRPLPLFTSLTVLVLVAGLIALPWQLYTHARFPTEAAWERAYTLRHMTEVLEGHHQPWTYYLRRMGHSLGPLVYVPVLWFCGRLLRRPLTSEQAALAAWFLVPYVLFSGMETKMPHYVVIALPALLLITASFWHWLREWCTQSPPLPRWQQRLGHVFLFALVSLAIEHSVERLVLLPFPPATRHPAWAAQLRHLREQLPPTPLILFNTAHPIEAMFYTAVPAYPFIPSAETVERLQQQGYHLVCLDQGLLPDYVRQNPQILIVPQLATETAAAPAVSRGAKGPR